MMKRQKPALDKGTTQKDLENGYTDQLEPDPNPWDEMEGYSDPFQNGTRGGFIKRNNYQDRL